jgi:hypothetical protein
MRLTDLDKTNTPVKALKENFAMDFDVSTLDKSKTRNMLTKVKGLINETRKSKDFHTAQKNPSYMKLMFMEQALTQHMKVAKSPRIVFENEEVEKSQVILAAQDMIDSVQKMYEDINDMLVKELPALVDSIQSEIGVTESDTFNSQASEALTTLNSTLQETQTALKGALGALTGQAPGDMMGGEMPELGADMGAEMGAEMGADAEAELNAPAPGAGPAGGGAPELPPVPDMGGEEEAPGAAVGRPKR